MARQAETVHVIDYDCHPPLNENLDRIASSLGRRFDLVKASSFTKPDGRFLTDHRRGMRLVHIDGDHTGAAVENDLEIAAELSNAHGVIILDDFMSWRFPDITETVYGFLGQNRRRLAMFACGDNKAFICSAKLFDFWADFAATTMQERIRAMTHCEFYKGRSEGRPIVSFRRVPAPKPQ